MPVGRRDPGRAVLLGHANSQGGFPEIANFYVSAERIFDRTLLNVPVIVLSNNDCCAVARSDEVKALGIKVGAPLHLIARAGDALAGRAAGRSPRGIHTLPLDGCFPKLVDKLARVQLLSLDD